jgi:SPP1 family phage portal protein
VPVIVYTGNPDMLPVFESVKPLIDEHDKIVSSDYANELERFANSYLLMLKRINTIAGDDGLSDADKIKQMRIFDGLGEDGDIRDASSAVAYLTKPSRGSDVAEAADRFERLIYEQSMVINPADKQFATVSGIALAYKILPMEWLTAAMMAYFLKGLQRRFVLIGNAYQTLFGLAPQWVTIHERRNLPIDLQSIAITAGQLKGILSDETILGLFPADIVPSIASEISKLEMQAMTRLPEPDNDSSRPE